MRGTRGVGAACAVILLLTSGCPSKKSRADRRAGIAPPPAPATVEGELFPPARVALLEAPALRVLPAQTAAVVVVPSLARAYEILDVEGVFGRRDAASRALFEAAQSRLGRSLPSLATWRRSGVALGEPAAMALVGTTVLLVLPLVDEAAFDGAWRKDMIARRGRYGLLAVAGPEDAARAVLAALRELDAADALPGDPAFAEASAAITFGSDLMGYVSAAMARHLAGLLDREWTGAGTVAFGMNVDHGRMSRIQLALASPAEEPPVLSVAPIIVPVGALLPVRPALGALGEVDVVVGAGDERGGRLERYQVLRQRHHGLLAELEQAVGAVRAELARALGTMVLYARVEGPLITLHGGLFATAGSTDLVHLLVHCWFVHSERHPTRQAALRLEQQLVAFRRDAERSGRAELADGSRVDAGARGGMGEHGGAGEPTRHAP